MALKKKVIQGGLDVQKSDGTSALTVDESNGAVNAGAASGTSTVAHRIYGYASGYGIGTATITVDERNSAFYNPTIVLSRNGTKVGSWRAEASAPIYVYNSTDVAVGGCTNAGVWTFSTTTDGGGHTFNSTTGTVVLNVDAANATGADAILKLTSVASNGGFLRHQRSSSRLYASCGNDLTGPYIAVNGTSWTTGSDLRLKNVLADSVQGLDAVQKLKPIKYTRKDVEGDTAHLGFIAQEVLPVIPEIVVGNEENMYGINYADLTPVLVKAIQELSAQVEELKAEVAALKGQ